MKLLGFFTLCLVWGTTWQAIKISLEGLPPFFGAGMRFLLASIILLFTIVLKKMPMSLSKRNLGLIVITAFFTYAIDYGFIYWGEQYLSAGVTAIFFATMAIFTAIFANFIFKNEAFHAKRSMGLLLGFAGVVIVFYDQIAITNFNRFIILASAAVIVAAASAALAVVIVKKYLTGVNPYILTFYQLVTGFIFLFVISLTLEDRSSVHFSVRVIAAVAYLGMVGSAFAFVIYYKLLQQMSAITLSLIIYITPLIAVLTDFIAFGEIVPVRSLAGMCVIFLGIGLTGQRRTAAVQTQEILP